MDLNQWLADLAAGFNFELKFGLVKQYLKILATWKLTPCQWEELNQRVLLRNDYFPKISQLYEVACEILREAEIKAGSYQLKDVWQGDSESTLGSDKA
jgi:hypothetical protein